MGYRRIRIPLEQILKICRNFPKGTGPIELLVYNGIYSMAEEIILAHIALNFVDSWGDNRSFEISGLNLNVDQGGKKIRLNFYSRKRLINELKKVLLPTEVIEIVTSLQKEVSKLKIKTLIESNSTPA